MAGRSLFYKTYSVVNNKVKAFIDKLHARRRRKNTIALRKREESDLDRWKNSRALDASWNERTYIMASFIKPGSKIIEFGAGNMSLKTRLPKGCVYQASDIISRHPGIIECDLNKGIHIDLSEYDTAIFSGVLEYVYNIENVVAQITGNIENIVLSYACSDISNAPRLDRGWLSDYTKAELEDIFKLYDYEVLDYKEWRNQSIYSLQKIDKAGL